MKMSKGKRERLESRGWKIGSAEEFLGLSPQESAYIEMKIAFGRQLRERRETQKLTQKDLAKRIHSSQSRVAKMEAGDPSVSMDLLVRSLLALGASRQELAQTLQSSG